MLDAVLSPVAQMIARRIPNHSLEAAFYTSPEIFRADLEAIFGRHWIYVAVEPDVPEPGDALVVDIGAASVLIVRDDDMQVVAFRNVCRHRGARLVRGPKATVGNLVCRYHAWTYGLDGGLLHAEHMGEDFGRSCRLKPVPIRSVAGLLFVCLAEQPPTDIDELDRVMTPYLAPHDISNTKVAHQTDLVEHGNWKLTMENNRECYHCAANHPELTIPLFPYGFGFAPDSLDDAGRVQAAQYACLLRDSHTQWESAGLPSGEIDRLMQPTGFRAERLPLDQTGESHTFDTRAASRRLLGELRASKLGALSFWTQPNSWHHFMADHIVTFSVLPLTPDSTLLRTKWLVHKDAVEGRDYDLENLTSVWEATNKQDAELVEITQQGVQDPAYEPGPYSPYTEELVEKFCVWYLDRLSASVVA